MYWKLSKNLSRAGKMAQWEKALAYGSDSLNWILGTQAMVGGDKKTIQFPSSPHTHTVAYTITMHKSKV